ncbi:hypothetical protein HK102_003456 [Quaeritorhiza haematococci]|nr:hypothetical protein HK102_003456 [Quaeritorhiza haematococci]
MIKSVLITAFLAASSVFAAPTYYAEKQAHYQQEQQSYNPQEQPPSYYRGGQQEDYPQEKSSYHPEEEQSYHPIEQSTYFPEQQQSSHYPVEQQSYYLEEQTYDAGSSDCGGDYSGCNNQFEAAKHHCNSKYGGYGTEHGKCIDHVVKEFDQCIRNADSQNEYCWSYRNHY